MVRRILTAASGLAVAASALGAAPATAQPTISQAVVAGAAKTPCSAHRAPGRVQIVRGMPEATKAKARQLLTRTVRCDSRALITLATKERPRLSFGVDDPKTMLAVPDTDGRYAGLATALTSTRPGYEAASKDYVWPRVATERHWNDPVAWREAIRAGLATEKDYRDARRNQEGYRGWRLSVNADGTWSAHVAGD
ncbi:MAG: hypothetical protein Q4G43_09380 [Mobilicoccus sp.]|nr:hypothetical protein [Mobilicoccus sp.]